MILILVLMNFLSCRDTNYPKIDDIEQLSPVFSFIEIDGKRYIDIETSYCLARMYRHERGYIGSVSEVQKLDITECHKVVGYSPDVYGDYTTWKESMRRWMIRQR